MRENSSCTGQTGFHITSPSLTETQMWRERDEKREKGKGFLLQTEQHLRSPLQGAQQLQQHLNAGTGTILTAYQIAWTAFHPRK